LPRKTRCCRDDSQGDHSGLFKGKYVGVDEAFGKDQAFLDSLPEGLVYFAEIPSNRLVFTGRPDSGNFGKDGKAGMSAGKPPFPPVKVKDIGDDPDVPREDVVLGIGAKGPVIGKDKCVKVFESRDGKPGKKV
jgi:hypothetical protein